MPLIPADQMPDYEPDDSDKIEPVDSPAVAVAEPPPKPKPAKRRLRKKPAAAKPSKLLAEEIARERRLAEAVEELVFRRHTLLADGLDLSVDEYRVLHTAVPKQPGQNNHAWKEQMGHYLKREHKRVQTIMDLQSAAGTPADQSAADQLAEKTAADRDGATPAIVEQMMELQSQLDGLNQAATNAESAADARHDANESLHDEKLLPQFVRDELDALRLCHKTDFGKELIQLETRRTQIQGALDLDVDDSADLVTIKGHVGGQDRFGFDEMDRLKNVFHYTDERVANGVSTRFGKIRPSVWRDYLDSLSAEMLDLEARIEELTNGEQATADMEVKKLRSFYCLD